MIRHRETIELEHECGVFLDYPGGAVLDIEIDVRAGEAFLDVARDILGRYMRDLGYGTLNRVWSTEIAGLHHAVRQHALSRRLVFRAEVAK